MPAIAPAESAAADDGVLEEVSVGAAEVSTGVTEPGFELLGGVVACVGCAVGDWPAGLLENQPCYVLR